MSEAANVIRSLIPTADPARPHYLESYQDDHQPPFDSVFERVSQPLSQLTRSIHCFMAENLSLSCDAFCICRASSPAGNQLE